MQENLYKLAYFLPYQQWQLITTPLRWPVLHNAYCYACTSPCSVIQFTKELLMNEENRERRPTTTALPL